MGRYEIMYILNAELDEAGRKAEMSKLHAILTGKGAKIISASEWGVRTFAYPINDLTKGFYVVTKITADEAALREWRRLSKIDPNVIRSLISVDKDIK